MRLLAPCLATVMSMLALAAADTPVAVSAPAPEKPVRMTIPYTVPAKGFVSLALYDSNQVLVRNLLCAQYCDHGGERVATWDGASDLGLAVPAGAYSAKAIFFTEQPTVSLIAKIGKSGDPPYRTPDGKGDWGGNLGPATGICANKTSVVSAWVCVEDNQITGVQQMDADGRIQMRYSTFYPWDCRWAAAIDERNLYLGILKDCKELQIAEYKLGNPRGRIMLTLPSKMSVTNGRAGQSLNGMALSAERIFASVTANNELFIVERATGKLLATVAVPGASGLAVVKDRLLVVSGTGVLRFTFDGKADGAAVPSGSLASPGALCVGDDGSLYVADVGSGATNQIHVFDAAGKHLRALGKPGGAAENGRYDGQNGFGSGLWMCMGPDGRSLFVNDVASGFPRTSRWSLSGVCEKEWFTGANDNFPPPVNVSRPDEVLKISGEFDPGNIQAWEVDPLKKTWHPAWRYSRPHADSWHDDVVRGFESGGNPLKQAAGYPGTWPMFPYGGEGGARTFKGRNYFMTASGAIYTYGPDAAPKLVAMVCTHRVERRGAAWQTFYNSGPSTWLTWADRNGDGKPQSDEVKAVENPAALGGAQWLKCFFDDQLNVIAQRWTAPDYSNAQPTLLCKIPLVEILPDGVPVYDMSKAETLVSLAKPDMAGGGPNKVSGAFLDSYVETADSWFSLIDASGEHYKLYGIDGDGWWASRNWRKKICRFDKATGKCLWAVGRRAPGVAQSGEMYNPTNLAGYGGDAVFAGDAMGVAWAWDRDGLYLGRLYNGPDDKRADGNSVYAEMMGARVYMVGEQIRIVANDTGTSVHEVHLPKRQALAVKPVTVTAEQARRVISWDPEGANPLAKPVCHVQSLALHPAQNPVKFDGDITPGEGWNGLADGTRLDEAQCWMDGDRVMTMRAMYDDQRLYLAYYMRTPYGPVNAGSELPICPFVSGAYVDVSFAPEWSQPQRPEVHEGDVRVLVAQIRGADGAAQLFQRGYWQKKTGGVGGQTITSPAASVHMDQIAEIPGLQQAWKVTGVDAKANRVNWQLELAIPLAALGLAHPQGRAIGFDTSVGIANAAGNNRDRAAHWAGLTEAAVVDRPGSSRLLPENWGTLIFMDH